MNRLPLGAALIAAPFLLAATVAQGNLHGRYSDGVYHAPGKLFRISSPLPDEPIVSDGRQPENNNAGALGLSVNGSHEVTRNDSWRGMAVVARGKHYYLLQTELRVEKLAGPDWRSTDASSS